MYELESILTGLLVSFGLIQVYQWHVRFPKLNRKPFNCAVCLAGWSAAVAYMLHPLGHLFLVFFGAVFIQAKLKL